MEDTPALVDLGRALEEAGYRFVTVSPETHRRVDARAALRTEAGRAGRDLRDVFGWSRAFDPPDLPPRILAHARAAGVLVEERGQLRSSVRFSSLHDRLFVHSAYPTLAPDAVFFGPDTYRFCDLVARELALAEPAGRLVDVGCGSGAGGLIAAKHARCVIFADVNPRALAFAGVNAALGGPAAREPKVELERVESDVLAGIDGPIDTVIANPPYMADPHARAYRDGGGAFGEALAVRIVRESLARLSSGGRLILYTGAAIVGGVDTFLASVRGICDTEAAAWRYREIDPDVFGDEIEKNDAYAAVERIAAVGLVLQAR